MSKTAHMLNIPMQTLSGWFHKSNQGHFKGMEGYSPETQALQDEIRQLKKALKRTEMERDILKKATAYFAKESQ